MRVVVPNVEYRGNEKKKSTKSENEYLIVYFEEASGKSSNILCRDIHACDNMQKGDLVNITADLDIGKYTKFEAVDFEFAE